MAVDYSIKQFATQKDWEEWLEKNHDKEPGIWIKIAKKASGIASVNYDEALDVALCYGWIDGQVKSIDEKFYKQKFTPRTKKSNWSKRNREIVAQLIKDKRMRPAGLAAINAAKKDGRWEAAYDSPKNMKVPEDFLSELSKNKKAYEFFESLNKSNKFAIAFQLATAKKPETRARRMKKFIDMMERGEKLY